MKLVQVHTCPLWADPGGSRTIGIDESRDEPDIVGWVNVAVMNLRGQIVRLLLVA